MQWYGSQPVERAYHVDKNVWHSRWTLLDRDMCRTSVFSSIIALSVVLLYDAQWLKYTFGAQELSENVGPPALSGAPVLDDGPRRSYSRHGLLRADYAEVIECHTLWHIYYKQCENGYIAARNRSSNGTTYMLYMFGSWNAPQNANGTNLESAERRSTAFRLTVTTDDALDKH